MSVLIEHEVGWIIDHQQEINNAYTTTCACEDLSVSCYHATEIDNTTVKQFTYHFKAVPQLFAICNAFMMDSQFSKYSQISSVSDDLTPVEKKLDTPCFVGKSSRSKKKRRCTVRDDGELEWLELQSKVKGYVEKALNVLAVGTLFELRAAENTDNNLTARQAAQIIGFTLHCHSMHCLPHDSTRHLMKTPLRLQKGRLSLKLGDIVNRLITCEMPEPTVASLDNHKFLLPANCRFLLSDISYTFMLLSDGVKYDCIVVDPPWQNKSVKRKRLYSTLSDKDLLQLPISELSNCGTLVVVWVTNCLRQQNFVRNHLLPHWHVTCVAEWYWLKVTRSGQPVCEFDDTRTTKRPYEVLIIGRRMPAENDDEGHAASSQQLPDHKVIVSVPCSIHSRKPPLQNILAEYLPENCNCLELFARNLTPGWTSWGNEVLAYQHLDYFLQVDSASDVDDNGNGATHG